MAQRSRVEDHVVTALSQLIRAAEAARHVGTEVELWKQLATIRPLDSGTAVGLMDSLARAGDRAGAIRHGRRCSGPSLTLVPTPRSSRPSSDCGARSSLPPRSSKRERRRRASTPRLTRLAGRSLQRRRTTARSHRRRPLPQHRPR
jgi:DNA-binding SARP family transcriptional activator